MSKHSSGKFDDFDAFHSASMIVGNYERYREMITAGLTTMATGAGLLITRYVVEPAFKNDRYTFGPLLRESSEIIEVTGGAGFCLGALCTAGVALHRRAQQFAQKREFEGMSNDQI